MSRGGADKALAACDAVMARLVAAHGPCRLTRRRRDPFVSLSRSVVSQMISTQAARTVFGRLEELLGEVTPERALAVSPERLRTAGLSRTKVRAIHGLATLLAEGALPRRLSRWSDQRVRDTLTGVPGVGEWTANMFLMFHLARPDVFPAKDLGIQEGIKRAYGLASRPSPREARDRAEAWAPYRTTAAWYLWRVLDGPVDD